MDQQKPTSQLRPFSLWLYLLIVFGLSWPFQIVSAVWGTELLLRYVLNATSMCMVTVGTFIAGRYVFRDGFAGAGWRWGKPKHYLLVIGLVLLLWVVPTLVDLSVTNVSLPGHLTAGQITWIFVLIFVTLIPGFGEEFGWRGYMLPHLARHHSPRVAVIIHAVIWWAWHLPILIGEGIRAGIFAAHEANLPVALSAAIIAAVVLLVSVVPAILHGVVFAYIWTRTRSLPVATVYHAAYDGVRDSLMITIGIGPIAGFSAVVLLMTLGVAFLWKGDWENLKSDATAPQVPATDSGPSPG